MNKIFIQPLRRIKWKLLLTILATLFIPVLWRTVRIHFIGSMTDTYAFSIAGNLQWINVIFEVLEEAFLLPLFYIFGKLFKNKDEQTNKKIIGKVYTIIAIYVLVITLAIILAPQLLKFMSPNTYSESTIKFIRFEFANRLFVMLIKVGTTLMILTNKWRWMLLFLTIQMGAMIFSDTFLISSSKVSLKLSVDNIAIEDMVINGVLSIGLLALLSIKFEMKAQDFIKPILKSEKKELIQITISGMESLIRNAFFIFFVIKVVNRLGNGYNQGDFWVTNTFAWSWLLLPIIALSEYANRDSALNNEKELSFWNRYGGLFILTTFVVLIWLIFMSTYKPFIEHVMNNDRADIINRLIFITLGFYILFAYNNVIDKSLYGEGRAELILLQSIITNAIVYLPFYFGVENPTIETIALMFGTAMGVDSILTFGMFAMYKMGWIDKLYKTKTRT